MLLTQNISNLQPPLLSLPSTPLPNPHNSLQKVTAPQPTPSFLPAAGIWGARVCDLAERYQGNVVNLEVAGGESYSLEQLTAAVEKHKPAVLFLVQGESSTGVRQSLAGVILGGILSMGRMRSQR